MREILPKRMINNDKVTMTLSEYDALVNAIKQHHIKQLKDNHKVSIKTKRNGEECPCCRHVNRIKRVPLHKSMTKALIRLYEMANGRPNVYILQTEIYKDFKKKSYNLGQWKHFGLVHAEGADEDNENPKSSGRYCLTQKGVDFINMSDIDDSYKIDRETYTFRDKLVQKPVFASKKPRLVGISKLLGEPFDYKIHALQTV